MWLLRVPKSGTAFVITGLIFICAGCSSEGNDIEVVSNRMRSDAISVAEAVSEVAEVGEVTHLSTCRNDGSGSIPPTTKVDLSLRDGASVFDAGEAAGAALADLGYETDRGSGNVLLVARRELDAQWGGEIRLYESSSSKSDLVLGTSIIPTITC